MKSLLMATASSGAIVLSILARSMLAQMVTTVLPTTRSRTCMCSFFTDNCIPPPPDYQEMCNASNSFTLSNGRFIDQYKTFCGCRLDRLKWEESVCLGTVADSMPIWNCHDDGTYHCRTIDQGKPAWCVSNQGILYDRVVNDTCTTCPSGSSSVGCNPVGSFCQSACIRYSSELRQFQNVGHCTCDVARQQQIDSTLSANDKYVPQCSADGSWQKLQTGYGGNWCVDSGGSPTTDISFDALYPSSC